MTTALNHICGQCSKTFDDPPRRGRCPSCYQKQWRSAKVSSLVAAGPTLAKVTALISVGWKASEIGRASGLDDTLIYQLRTGRRRRVSTDTAALIAMIDPSTRTNYTQSRWHQPLDQGHNKRLKLAAEGVLTREQVQQIDKQEARRRWNEREKVKRARQRDIDMAARLILLAEKTTEVYEPTEPATAAQITALGIFDKDTEYHYRDEAVCSGTDPEIFFPEKGGSTREGKKVCLGCPVRAECLQDAMDHDERFGIWGGFSERERRAMKRALG